MKKKKVYIFNKTSRAAVYGIGTYISQLINCLKNTDIEFELINLYGEGNEVEITEMEGIRQISIPQVNLENPTSTRYYSRNIAYLLKEFIPVDKNVDYIFHLNFMTEYELIVRLKKMFKCKIILVCHYTNWSFDLLGDEKRLEAIMSGKYTPLKKNAEKRIKKGVKEDIKMIKKCDRFVCVAQHTLNTFLNITEIDKSKCQIINNALEDKYIKIPDIERDKLKEKYFLDKNTRIIFFAGRLDEVKGISSLISAFKKVLRTNKNTHLLLAGDGDYTRWINESNDCWTRISFTGRLGKEQLYELYRMADLGIVCSLHEEFGLVAIEMMMHQLPVIVSETGGLAEIVEDNVSGIKVKVQTIDGKRTIDPEILANHIITILNNSGLATKLAIGARQKFLKKYEISVFRNKMLNLYKEI